MNPWSILKNSADSHLHKLISSRLSQRLEITDSEDEAWTRRGCSPVLSDVRLAKTGWTAGLDMASGDTHKEDERWKLQERRWEWRKFGHAILENWLSLAETRFWRGRGHIYHPGRCFFNTHRAKEDGVEWISPGWLCWGKAEGFSQLLP